MKDPSDTLDSLFCMADLVRNLGLKMKLSQKTLVCLNCIDGLNHFGSSVLTHFMYIYIMYMCCISPFPLFQKLKRFPSETETEHEPSRGMIQAEHRCDFCQQSPLCNRKGVFEALLFCKDCTAKGKLM